MIRWVSTFLKKETASCKNNPAVHIRVKIRPIADTALVSFASKFIKSTITHSRDLFQNYQIIEKNFPQTRFEHHTKIIPTAHDSHHTTTFHCPYTPLLQITPFVLFVQISSFRSNGNLASCSLSGWRNGSPKTTGHTASRSPELSESLRAVFYRHYFIHHRNCPLRRRLALDSTPLPGLHPCYIAASSHDCYIAPSLRAA